MKAVLFRSKERFDRFAAELQRLDIDCTVLSFEDHDWVDYDFSDTDFVIYYPSFRFSSRHPMTLQDVRDNIVNIQERYPHLQIYPDPGVIKYYNDKYVQFLFLREKGFPIPETIPLFSETSVDLAAERLGFPLVVKNRYGAGGDVVFMIKDRRELMTYYRMSKMDMFHTGALAFFARMMTKRIFYYNLIKARNMQFPFFSPPLIAQKFVQIDRDLKTVTGDGKVVEAHWRYQADSDMWKMNIDGGGTGVWGFVPDEALDLSVKLANAIGARWLNIDFIQCGEEFLISEFSPVWHHYAYGEKDSFVYQEDYNIEMPLEVSLNLEHIIVDSLINASRAAGAASGRTEGR